jgi:hypothetical protein
MLKAILPLAYLIFVLIPMTNAQQKKLKVVKVENSLITKIFPNSVDKHTDYFRIKLISDKTDLGSLSYPLVLNAKVDTIALIEELLKFKSDSRVCALPLMYHNSLSSQIYNGKCKSYSIQVEALFIIDQLFFEKPFEYSSIPILVDRKNNDEESIEGIIVIKAFDCYEKWFARVKKVGMMAARKSGDVPLKDCQIYWY